MSDQPEDEVVTDGPRGVADHGDAPGHASADLGHADEPLGPIDWPAYGAGALGFALGLAMAAAFAISVGAV